MVPKKKKKKKNFCKKLNKISSDLGEPNLFVQLITTAFLY